MYSVEFCTNLGVLKYGSSFAAECQLLDVSSVGRSGSCQDRLSGGVPVRGASASGQLSPEAAGRAAGSSPGVRLPAELLLRSRGVPQAGHTAVGAFSRSQGVSPWRDSVGRRDAARGQPAASSRAVPVVRSGPTNHRSLASLLGVSSFRRLRSGRSLADFWCRCSRSLLFRWRCCERFSKTANQIPARSGSVCSCFSRRSRSPGA